MRKIIAALEMSLDGCIEGPHGALDWIDAWDNPYDDLLGQIDTCILGRVMYPGYENYWRSILAAPGAVLPLTGKAATPAEIAYARFAAQTPHLVLSRTLQEVSWPVARIVRDAGEIRDLKRRPGKALYAVGGAGLVSGLMNLGLLDELRLVVHPLVLGGGKALFKDVQARHALSLLGAVPTPAGKVRLTYRVAAR